MQAFTPATNLHEAEKDGKMLFEDPCGTKVNFWAFLVPFRKHAMSRRADVLERAELMTLQMPRESMAQGSLIARKIDLHAQHIYDDLSRIEDSWCTAACDAYGS